MSLPLTMPPDPDPIEERIPALRLRQPIGDIYIAGLDHKLLQKITYFDVRRVLRDQRDVEAYLGIQRPLNEARVAALHKYVNFVDATFPTSVILAIDDSDFAYFDEAIFGRVYTFVTAPGNMVPRSKFEEVFKRSKFKDADFTTDTFKPGTSGEAKLRNELLAQLDLPSGG